MPKLDASKRARLPDSAFAYVDSRGNRRLPINDEAHVRNALARFNQVSFESEEAREKARLRLLKAARKYKIVPVGFISGELANERATGATRTRAAEAARLPIGEVTLLMTDIEGSSNLVHDLGDRYGELLDEMREMIRLVVTRNRGFEVDARADEFFAVFENPVDALTAALEIQGELKKLSSRMGRKISMRIGIHTGRPTRRGGSYIGLAVHMVARLCSIARGGEVVVSADTRRAVRGSGFRFRSKGTLHLAGIPGDHEVFQLGAP